jgi:hypothetical protein
MCTLNGLLAVRHRDRDLIPGRDKGFFRAAKD